MNDSFSLYCKLSLDRNCGLKMDSQPGVTYSTVVNNESFTDPVATTSDTSTTEQAMSRNTSSPSNLPMSNDSTSGGTASGANPLRTRSPGFFDHFRRRSKSDCKSASLSETPVSQSPAGSRRRGHSFISSIKSHIPWNSDRRANSIECGHSQNEYSDVNASCHRSHQLHDGSSSNHHHTSSSGQPSQVLSSTNQSTNTPGYRQKGRFLLSPQVPSVLLQGNNHQHNNLDPYYTYTYGQDHRHLYRRSRSGSGSSVARVMDLFKPRSDSLSHSGSGSGTPSGLLGSGSGSVKRSFDFSDLRENDTEHLVFVKFFQHYKCYDLIPISAKLIVFDTQLLVKKAFHALVSNGVRAAPLWDSESQSYIGMLTITDFINILRISYKSPGLKLDELEDQKLSKWRSLLSTQVRPLSTISPDASLFDAIKTLIHEKVHRLPVVDDETKNVLYIMTHKRILKFLFLYFKDLPIPRHLDQPIRQLNVGTYENIATTTMETPLIDALNAFVDRRVSALPVVDQNGKVIDIYAKFDVIVSTLLFFTLDFLFFILFLFIRCPLYPTDACVLF